MHEPGWGATFDVVNYSITMKLILLASSLQHGRTAHGAGSAGMIQ
jgi:hypothetical protein